MMIIMVKRKNININHGIKYVNIINDYVIIVRKKEGNDCLCNIYNGIIELII